MKAQKSKAAVHKLIKLNLPPSAVEKRRHPFTEMVMELAADGGTALVYDRQEGEGLQRVAALCGAAIRCARRREETKIFTVRMINQRGRETYAVWRIK